MENIQSSQAITFSGDTSLGHQQASLLYLDRRFLTQFGKLFGSSMFQARSRFLYSEPTMEFSHSSASWRIVISEHLGSALSVMKAQKTLATCCSNALL
jgi:hypothetical protein